MLRILFWNLNRSSPLDDLATLTRDRGVDVLILAESGIGMVDMMMVLNKDLGLGFHVAPSECKRITIYSRFSPEYLTPVFDSPYMTIRHVKLPARPSFLLVAVHLRSRLRRDTDSQQQSLGVLAHNIRRAEEDLSTEKTILIGDLNSNPFEPGLSGAQGLNAVMTRERAERGSRTVDDQPYAFFYNPMWSLMGDLSDGPAGTYHYQKSDYVEYFWNTYDQVLLRPSMLEYFQRDELHILTRNNGTSFVTSRGYPDATSFSDHLPILIGLGI